VNVASSSVALLTLVAAVMLRTFPRMRGAAGLSIGTALPLANLWLASIPVHSFEVVKSMRVFDPLAAILTDPFFRPVLPDVSAPLNPEPHTLNPYAVLPDVSPTPPSSSLECVCALTSARACRLTEVRPCSLILFHLTLNPKPGAQMFFSDFLDLIPDPFLLRGPTVFIER
jgi:hypothetical protein